MNVNFLVVRAVSQYNIIVGRPGILELGVVVSTVHALMKFSTLGWVVTIKPERKKVLECQWIEEGHRQKEADESKDKVSINS